jgi:hypothetical protein
LSELIKNVVTALSLCPFQASSRPEGACGRPSLQWLADVRITPTAKDERTSLIVSEVLTGLVDYLVGAGARAPPAATNCCAAEQRDEFAPSHVCLLGQAS